MVGCGAKILGPIKIGNNVRIDDFCLLSGNIELGNFIHIAPYTALYGGDKGIFMDNFTGVSSHCSLYSITDDYSGHALTNPTVPQQFRQVTSEKIKLNKHCLVGAGCVILPGVEIREGTSIGAMSLVTKSTKPWKIYFGRPARVIGERSKHILELEQQLKNECKE